MEIAFDWRSNASAPRSHQQFTFAGAGVERAGTMAVDSLLDQLTFYGSYHRDARNKAVHLVCVPLIAWSVLVWLWACDEVTVLENALPDALARHAPTAPATLVVLAYAGYYASLDGFAGMTWAACVGVPLRVTSRAFHAYATSHAWRWGLAAHCLGWTLQIYPGHLAWENAAPPWWTRRFSPWCSRRCSCGWRCCSRAGTDRACGRT